MKRFIFLFLIIVFSFNIFSQKNIENKNDLTYLFIEAIKNKTFGNYNQSAYLFSKYTQVDSSCIACLYELSKLYLNSGDYKGALYFSYKSYKADTLNYWYIKNYAEILRLSGRYNEALKIYLKIQRYFGNNVDDKFSLAAMYLKSKNPGLGLIILDSIEMDNGISEKIYFEKYKFYFDKKRYDDALNILFKISKSNPDKHYVNGLIADIYSLKNKKKDALYYYKIFVEKDPNNATALLLYCSYLIENKDTTNGFILLNNIFKSDSVSKDDKVGVLKSLLFSSKNNSKISSFLFGNIDNLVDILKDTIPALELACDFYELKHSYDKSLNYVNKLIKKDQDNGVHWERAFFYLNLQNNYDSICKISASVISKFNDRPFLFLIAGVAYQQKNSNNMANYYFKSGLKLIKEKNELYRQLINLLAESYIKINNIDSAFYYFELAIEDKDIDLSVYNNYAYYLALNNQKLIKALELSRISIKKYPKNASYLDTYAWICYKIGNFKDALEYIELAFKYSHIENNELTEHYGDILFCNNKKRKAVKMWNKTFSEQKDLSKLKEKIHNFKCK